MPAAIRKQCRSLLTLTAESFIATLVLPLSAEHISKWIGECDLLALERLMGLLLTAIAVEMLLLGIEAFVRQLQAG